MKKADVDILSLSGLFNETAYTLRISSPPMEDSEEVSTATLLPKRYTRLKVYTSSPWSSCNGGEY